MKKVPDTEEGKLLRCSCPTVAAMRGVLLDAEAERLRGAGRGQRHRQQEEAFAALRALVSYGAACCLTNALQRRRPKDSVRAALRTGNWLQITTGTKGVRGGGEAVRVPNVREALQTVMV